MDVVRRVNNQVGKECVCQEVCQPQHVVTKSNQSRHNACSGGVVGLGMIRVQSKELLLVRQSTRRFSSYGQNLAIFV
jgi:hypothetical protein